MFIPLRSLNLPFYSALKSSTYEFRHSNMICIIKTYMCKMVCVEFLRNNLCFNFNLSICNSQSLTQPARIRFRQNILHSQNVCIFWSLFVYRITGAIQKNPPLLLPFSDFFKLLFESNRWFDKMKSLVGLFWAVPQSTFV